MRMRLAVQSIETAHASLYDQSSYLALIGRWTLALAGCGKSRMVTSISAVL